MEANTVFRSSPGRSELMLSTDFSRQDAPPFADRNLGAASKPQQIAEYDIERYFLPAGAKRMANPRSSEILKRYIASYFRILFERSMAQHVSTRRGTLTHCPMCAHPIVQDAPETAYFRLSPSPEIGHGIPDWFAFPAPVAETRRWVMSAEPSNAVVSPPGVEALLIEPGPEVSLATRMDVAEQLGCMREMEDGWLDGAGKAPTHEGLTKLGDLFAMHFSSVLPQPYLYPTPEGGIRAEWTFGSNEVSLNIDLESLSGEWHTVDLATREDEEQTLNLTAHPSWQWLSARIQALENIPE